MIPKDIQAAVEVLKNHPAVIQPVNEPQQDGDIWILQFDLLVELPRDAAANGESLTGVREREPITLKFGPSYPLKAPYIELRNDFNRAHPHINPSPQGSPVNPCVSEIPLDELLHDPGWLGEIINRIAQWLNDAASGDLMDCSGQGWEPIRRDDVKGKIVFDPSSIRGHSARAGGPGGHYVGFTYTNLLSGYACYLTHLKKPATKYKDAIKRFEPYKYHEGHIRKDTSLGLVLWAGRSHISDCYYPDDVSDIATLTARAEEYGCHVVLNARLMQITDALKDSSIEQAIDFAVIFVVKRPCKIIGQDSEFEVIPYRFTVSPDKTGKPNFEEAKISALGHINDINASLLARLSNRETVSTNQNKILMTGCGSLGSKIAIHLARAGFENFRLVDNDYFSPHNNARHGVIYGEHIVIPKVFLLSHSIEQLGANATPIHADIIQGLASNPVRVIKRSSLIIDTTASQAVCEAFAATPKSALSSTLVRAELYAQGKLGVIYIEGKERNPRIDDLKVQLYQLGIENTFIGSCLYQRIDHERVPVGQSCGSYTMAMSDADVSSYASVMSKRIQKGIDTDFPDEGDMLIGVQDDDDLGITWHHYSPWEIEVYRAGTGSFSWEVRMPLHLINKMSQLAEAAKPNETGGILIGHISWGRRVLTISDLMDPPQDSTGTPVRFTLGVQGLRAKLNQLEHNTGGVLTYLGTWHSHPRGGGASRIDQETLSQLVNIRRLIPTVCLIIGPDGVHAVPGPATEIG